MWNNQKALPIKFFFFRKNTWTMFAKDGIALMYRKLCPSDPYINVHIKSCM